MDEIDPKWCSMLSDVAGIRSRCKSDTNGVSRCVHENKPVMQQNAQTRLRSTQAMAVKDASRLVSYFTKLTNGTALP